MAGGWTIRRLFRRGFRPTLEFRTEGGRDRLDQEGRRFPLPECVRSLDRELPASPDCFLGLSGGGRAGRTRGAGLTLRWFPDFLWGHQAESGVPSPVKILAGKGEWNQDRNERMAELCFVCERKKRTFSCPWTVWKSRRVSPYWANPVRPPLPHQGFCRGDRRLAVATLCSTNEWQSGWPANLWHEPLGVRNAGLIAGPGRAPSNPWGEAWYHAGSGAR